MFKRRSEKVHYYPSIGKNDKIKDVSCQIDVCNTEVLFKEDASRSDASGEQFQSTQQIIKTENSQIVSNAGSNAACLFLPDALMNGNTEVLPLYLKRLKNKKINSYINLNIPVKKQYQKLHVIDKIYKSRLNSAFQNIQLYSRIEQSKNKTDRKGKNTYIYEKQVYSVKKHSKKALDDEKPITITYQLIKVPAQGNQYEKRCYFEPTSKKSFERTKTYRKNYEKNYNIIQTKEKTHKSSKVNRKTPFLQDEITSRKGFK